MTKFPYDEFSKNYLNELLRPLGKVETSRKVPAEIREIDVYFLPSSQQPPQDIMQIGILGRLALQPALIEPFRNAATRSEIRSCIGKLFTLFADIERGSKTRVREGELPRLWILSPTVSKAITNGLNSTIDEQWGLGVYFLGDVQKSAVIAIHQLPRTPDTLWLRIMGRGRVREQAVRELEALPESNTLRKKAIELLLSLKTTLEFRDDIKKDKDERRLIMQLSPLYEQKLAEVKLVGQQEGIQEGIQAERRAIVENLLKVRFGAVDNELSLIMRPIILLSPEEFAPLVLQLSQLSREELLDRFS
ncbi:hypothetical protein NIES4071_19930 [Calothrix sp. NIES-4071]|nr:hypothetical protein NIES4071_19930 [Calothrix sp. NIES-4071]BAZ56326.1 hypothetical protein NIES4105_19880 [Calothrix sp. NIES-4105]